MAGWRRYVPGHAREPRDHRTPFLDTPTRNDNPNAREDANAVTKGPDRRKPHVTCKGCNTEISLIKSEVPSTHCPECGHPLKRPKNPLQQHIKIPGID